MGRVTVVGSYIVALVMDSERIPLEGETLVGWNYHATHGGKGSNMAVCAARLGAESRFLGKIGQDPFGEQFVSLLRREGVNLNGVLYSSAKPTAVGFIIFSRKGTNAILIDMGANGDFLPDDVKAHQHLIERSDVIVSPLEIPLETAIAAAEVARANGVKAILNPAPAQDLRPHDLSCFFALTPNEIESRVCLGLPPDAEIEDKDLAKALLQTGVEHVLLTCGERGAVWCFKEHVVAVPALKVKAVDTVGAGDAFNAGLATGLSEGLSVREAIALGITAASLSTEKRETIDSYPYRENVSRRMHEVLLAIA